VFDFLERQGAFFGLDGEDYPPEPAAAWVLPPAGGPWQAQPRFRVRGLVPWLDSLNCVTVYNREDWRAYLEATVRMRFNTLGVHVSSGANKWAESFLSFEYAGAGHLAPTDTTATNRWGYLPQPTSRYGMGAADSFAGEVFGSEATTEARTCREAAERAGILEETDRERLILCSWRREVKNGHSEIHAYSGDYDEAFQFWENYEPSESVKKSQAEVARKLRALADAAASPAEHERLNYLARFVELLTPYSEACSPARRLNQKLQQASELKRQGNKEEAAKLVWAEGVARFLRMVPLVREVLLNYQEIVTTRNDQGQLASVHNKLESFAFYRLFASISELSSKRPPKRSASFTNSVSPTPPLSPGPSSPRVQRCCGEGNMSESSPWSLAR
jgi:hypothetical protein